MIQGLFLDQLRPGRLPVYETYPDARQYVLYHTADGHRWAIHRDLDLYNRVNVPMSIDTTLETFERDLRRWIAEAQILPENGTLLFTIIPQSKNPEQDHLGHVLLAGMVYLPTFDEMAIDLREEPEDVADLIIAFCRDGYEYPAFRRLMEEYQRSRIIDEKAEAELRQAEEIASLRARRLLDECLTPAQRTELTNKDYFHVQAKNGEVFRIRAERHQNIFRIENEREVMRYCVVISATVPVYDGMLAQKLLIEHSFEEFQRLSNKWDLTRQRERSSELADLLEPLFTRQDLLDAEQFVIEPLLPEANEQRRAG